MSFWKLFAGPSPEKLMARAETLRQEKQWGPAKVALERALEKAADAEMRARLNTEIATCCDHLAAAHLAQAEVLAEGGHRREAVDLYRLAAEVARDADLQESARRGLTRLEAAVATPQPVYYSPDPLSLDPADAEAQAEEATFWALIGTLPEDMQDAYESYGESFRSGYLALNGGDFEAAARLLAEAHAAHPEAGTYIPLELAAAYTHLGRTAEARELLEGFLHYHPDILPAYQLLCDLLWEAEDFSGVDALLSAVPAELVDTVALVLLRAENLRRAARLDEAGAFLEEVLKHHGWSDPVAELLAAISIERDNPERARSIYAEIIQRCQSCHSRVDPMVKHQYAELSFAAGQRDTALLELYLALAQEAPAQAGHYFRRVSAIYTEQGYAQEAARFRALSERS